MAPTPFPLADTLPADPAVLRGTLPNGLTYYIRANAKPEKRAELRLAVNAGSVLEDDDQRGLAHFVEHMAFNGTAHFAKHELTDFLESIGMRFGPDLNAYTSFDETVYMLHVPTDSFAVLDKAFLILRDWASGLTLEGEEIDKERGVILEEWRLGRGADARIDDKHHPVVYWGSRYGQRLPIGDPAVIEHCPHEALRRFYRDWYRPDLMAVVAVGDFDPAQIKVLIERHFADLEPPTDPREREAFPVPDHDSLLCVVATDPEATRTEVSVHVKRPRRAVVTGKDFRQRLVETLCLGILTQRLQERTTEADPPFILASAEDWPIARTKDAVVLSATVRDGGLLRGLEALLGEERRVALLGFTDTELERQKRVLLRDAERRLAERDKTDSWMWVWPCVRSFLRQDPLLDVEFRYRFMVDYLPTVTLEEVNAAFARLREGSRVITVGAPSSSEPLPTEDEILGFVASLERRDAKAYSDSLPAPVLMDERPAPGRILEERFLEEVDAVEWTLSNGVRVVLKPTDFQNDEILFSSFSLGGLSLVPDSLYVPAVTATEVVTECGVGPFSRVQLDKVLAGSVVRVNPTIGSTVEGIEGSCSPRDLEKALQLVHLYFTAPRADSQAFASMLTRWEDRLKHRSLSPEQAFSDTVTVTITQYHPRFTPWTIERVREMDLGRSLAFFRDRFADASDFTFVFVGAVDPDTMRPLVEAYLGSLPDLRRGETWRDVGPTRPSGVVEKEVRRGVEKKSLVRLAFPGPFAWSVAEVHRVRSMARALQIILRERIREDLGGTYGIGVWPSIQRFPREECIVWISFGCNPDRVDELVGAVFEEIFKVQQDGPDSLTFAKVKEGQRREFERNLKENRFWLDALYEAYLNGIPLGEILAYPRLIDALTADDIRQAARERFPQGRYVKVVLYPAGELPTDSRL